MKKVKKVLVIVALLFTSVLSFWRPLKKVSAEEPPVSSENYVRFVSGSSRTITPKYTNSGITLQYSVDSGATWTTIASESETTSATEHWFRGEATGTKSLFTSYYNFNQAWTFSGNSDLEVYGNLNYLLCDALGDEEAPTNLENNAYAYMFYNCTSLTVAPELPATTLGDYCYYEMFDGCTSLTTAPELPATTLASSCYRDMFRGCTSLTIAPELPATTLANSCYENMFLGCTSFKVSATQTGAYTYAWRIPTSGTGTTAPSWNYNMLYNTGGTFTSGPTINTIYYVENKPVSKVVEVISVEIGFNRGKLVIGQTYQINPIVEPENAELTYYSSDETVATVSASGLVSAVGVGSTIITAIAGGKFDTVVFTVVEDTYSAGYNDGYSDGFFSGKTVGYSEATDSVLAQVYEFGISTVPKSDNTCYDNTESFDYRSGYGQAWGLGYDLGYSEGSGRPLTPEEEGIVYNWGYNAGYKAGQEDHSVGGLLKQAFGGVGQLLDYELLPNLTIGGIVIVPLLLGIIFFILKRG